MGDVPHAPTAGEFLWRLFYKAVFQSLGIADLVSGVIGTLVAYFSRESPTLTSDLAWEIPLYTFIAIVLARLVVAPYLMWSDERRQVVALSQDLLPKAKIVFDPQNRNYVQPGHVYEDGASAGSTEACDEYLYALGIVSLSSRPVMGCRVFLEAAEPHNTSEQRLGRSMRVRNDPDEQSDGEFTLNPGDGQRPGVYVEVLQEVVPPNGRPARIRLRYANTTRAQANWFTNYDTHVLTFRLEGGLASPVWFALRVSYDDDGQRRWRVESIEAPPAI